MPKGVYKRDMSPEASARRSTTQKEVQKEAMNRPKVREKLRIAREGKSYEEIMGIEKAKETKKKQSESHTGKHRSEEAKANMRHPKSEEARINMKGKCGVYEHKPNSKEQNAKIREATRKNWQNPKFREKQLKAIFGGMRYRPTKPEKQLDELFQERFPNEWKYVGDGSFWMRIDGKFVNPDFININEQKKIIEMFGDYYHGEGVTGTPNEQHEQERIDLFAQCGYQTLVIWEHELKNVKVLTNRITEFSEE